MSVSPPRPKGPPLNSLRAFEAAARLGGFALAAEELCVTPGAIAQHIKTLEAWAGTPLFERKSQGVTLTARGASILPDFTAAFDQLGAAIHGLKSRATPREIRIATLPSLAQLWLSPRLPRIRQEEPGLSISVTAMENPPNLAREPYDLAFFYKKPPLNGASLSLGKDVIFPVCTPQIAENLTSIDDLQTLPCLQDDTWSEDWNSWLRSSYPGKSLNLSGPSFSLYALALEEARNGAGVLIAHEALVQTSLASGLLVRPFPQKVTLEQELSVTIAPPAQENRLVQRALEILTAAH